MKPLHPQRMKYCKNCVDNRRGPPPVKDIVEYLDEKGVESHVRLCRVCDQPGVLTIYDLDPERTMP